MESAAAATLVVKTSCICIGEALAPTRTQSGAYQDRYQKDRRLEPCIIILGYSQLAAARGGCLSDFYVRGSGPGGGRQTPNSVSF